MELRNIEDRPPKIISKVYLKVKYLQRPATKDGSSDHHMS